MPNGKRSVDHSVSFNSWISPEDAETLDRIAEHRTRKLGRPQKRVDAFRFILASGVVGRYARFGRWGR